MRPKGWRLDPKWIAHYEVLEKARIEREITRIQMDMQMKLMREENEQWLRAGRERELKSALTAKSR